MGTIRDLTTIIDETGPLDDALTFFNKNVGVKGQDSKQTVADFKLWLRNSLIVPSPTESLYRQAVINPYMLVSQRGDFSGVTAIVDGQYYLDTWKAVNIGGGTMNMQHQTILQPSSLPYSKSIRITNGNGSNVTGKVGMEQIIENENAKFFQGKEVTASALVNSSQSTNVRVLIDDGTTVSSSSIHTGSGTWERLTVTAVMAASLTNITIKIQISTAADGDTTIFDGEDIAFTDISFQLSDLVMGSMPRHLSQELALCKRYYQVIKFQGVQTDPISWAFANSTSVLVAHINLPVELMTDPTITVNVANVGNVAGSGNVSIVGATYGSITKTPDGVVFTINLASPFTANAYYAILLTAAGGGEGIEFKVEL